MIKPMGNSITNTQKLKLSNLQFHHLPPFPVTTGEEKEHKSTCLTAVERSTIAWMKSQGVKKAT
jgi:hypothetical protein